MTPTDLQLITHAIRAYAELHPRPSHVTQAQAADMLNLSRHTVSRLVRTGALKLNACGLIPIGEVDAALAARTHKLPKRE